MIDAASPVPMCRRRRLALVVLVLLLGWLVDAAQPARAQAPACTEGGVGWCLARRFAGEVPEGELGFRFGEPLDADGDGRADVAAGSRFKLEGIEQTGTAAVWSGASGSRLRAWDGDVPGGLFGHSVLPVPDLDGDGLADVIVSAPNARIQGVFRGLLVARSPKSGKEIWRRAGSRNENFGWDLAPADDDDGDGHGDLFVGAPSAAGGRVYLLSGKDGRLLRRFAPRQDDQSFGWYVARVDDLDGDTRADLAAGAHLEKSADGASAGGVYVFSSRSGDEIHHWKGSGNLTGFGEVVAALSDQDGDGRGEIAVAAPRTNDRTRAHPGEVTVYSGGSGSPLRRWSGTQAGELFGRMVVDAGDLDGDGIGDVAIGAPWHRRGDAARAGRVELRCGRTGEVLAGFGELFGDLGDAWFGWHIRRAPDPDGLGRPALLVGSLRRPVGGQPGVGVIDLYVLRRAP